jgi:aminoglycoside 3-N-acetyltransferase
VSGEARTIQASPAPVTQAGIADELRALGVRPGSVLLVHTAMSALGWVCGGAQAVVGALLDALGPDGTLVVPTHTNGNSEPSEWENPPVPRTGGR